ncbi:MAG: phosphatidate cytidylyltransferase [Mycoplasmoidaceae bacterium]|nr:MAG: phosphatidate cytidylyltransferase [Mycoplasmoidaceae bacterium]
MQINKLSDERRIEFRTRLKSSVFLLILSALYILFAFLADSRHESNDPKHISKNGFAFYLPLWANSIFACLIMLGIFAILYFIALELDNCFIKSQHSKRVIIPLWLLIAVPFTSLCILILYSVYWGKNADWKQISPIIYFGIFIAMFIIILPLVLIIKKSNNYNKFNGFYFPFICMVILVALSGIVYLTIVRGAVTILFIVLIPICSDTGGYFFGVFFGKHKMAPKLSPKKTWEGVIGSFFMAFAVAALLLYLFGIGYANSRFQLQGNVLGNQWNQAAAKNDGINPGEIGWWFLIICVLTLLVFCSIFGDLFFSLFKRKNGLKDYSNLIKGHGGVLDRIDSWIIVFAVFFMITILTSGISTIASGWQNANRIFNCYYVDPTV